MTISNSWEYGRCPCSGVYERRRVEVRITNRDKVYELADVSQGACPECGSKVYKAAVLQVIEALMRGEPVEPDAR